MMEPLFRVAHVMGKMRGGGVESVVMSYYRHIDRDLVQFDFLVDSDSTCVPRAEIERMGGRVFEVPPIQRIALYGREMRSLFRRERWQIVHSHLNALSVFPLRAAKQADVPVRIAHSHSAAGGGEHARNAVKAVLKRHSNAYPTHRFACSRYAGEWLFGKGSDFEVVYNAIDLDKFSFDPSVRAGVRASLGLPDGCFAIGHVGRFMTQKNHAFLIDAFAILCGMRDGCMLLCVGDGDLRRSVERLARERGVADKVMFLGQRDDVASLYQAFDVFVLPSLYEGLCIVGVEAQRSGLDCVLSDAITREVDLTGSVEFLPIDRPQVWAEALAASRGRSGAGVQDELFTDYDIRRAAKRLSGLYMGMLDGGGRMAANEAGMRRAGSPSSAPRPQGAHLEPEGLAPLQQLMSRRLGRQRLSLSAPCAEIRW